MLTEHYICGHCLQAYTDVELEESSRCVFAGSREEPPEYVDICPDCGAEDSMIEARKCDDCGEVVEELVEGTDWCEECEGKYDEE